MFTFRIECLSIFRPKSLCITLALFRVHKIDSKVTNSLGPQAPHWPSAPGECKWQNYSKMLFPIVGRVSNINRERYFWALSCSYNMDNNISLRCTCNVYETHQTAHACEANYFTKYIYYLNNPYIIYIIAFFLAN